MLPLYASWGESDQAQHVVFPVYTSDFGTSLFAPLVEDNFAQNVHALQYMYINQTVVQRKCVYRKQ